MKRILKRNFLFILIADVILAASSWYLAHLLRFNFSIPGANYYAFLRILPLVIGIKILAFYIFDLYQGMWRYTSLTDLVNIFKAASFGSLVIILMVFFVHGFAGFARSIFIIDWFMTLLLISGSRVAVRIYFWIGAGDESTRLNWKAFFPIINRHKPPTTKKLLIIGAGDCGEKIFREIHDNSQLGYHVVGFIDDDPYKANRKIHGIPVLGNVGEIRNISTKLQVDELLIAVPSASSDSMRTIVHGCEESGILFKTVPGMGELINGRVSVKAIRDVAYKDLLGREPVHLDEERIGSYIKGKRVLITGAGGSIGSELCRQVSRYTPESIMLYERAESPLYEIEMELREEFQYIKITPKLADILDPLQLERAFEEERPHVVFHAAAYKHVPMLELQPWIAMSNNVRGTRNVIAKACEFEVERFVLVSTDKAVRPVNMMGASKSVTELLVQSQNCLDSSGTKFITVRFGNVVGSVGSVIPFFKKQIEKGGPVTVTHPEITRYFMTIPEACQLILQAGSMGNGGEIYILDMGTPIKIADMAQDLIRLSGFEPEVDIKIKYVGLRPGEKLTEELSTENELIIPTEHEKIMVLKGVECNTDIVNGKVDELLACALKQDREGINHTLKALLPDYTPFSET